MTASLFKFPADGQQSDAKIRRIGPQEAGRSVRRRDRLHARHSGELIKLLIYCGMSGNSRGPDRAGPVISLTMKTPVTLGKKRARRARDRGAGQAPSPPRPPPPPQQQHLLLICRRLSTVRTSTDRPTDGKDRKTTSPRHLRETAPRLRRRRARLPRSRRRRRRRQQCRSRRRNARSIVQYIYRYLSGRKSSSR